MKNAVNWFEIYALDFERAKKFYTEVFKCNLTDVATTTDRHSSMDYAVFPNSDANGGAGGALVRIDEAKPGIGGTLVYFDSKDIDEELSRVTVNGGKIIRPKLKVGDFGFIALVEDTEGNMIGLRSKR